MGAMMYVSHNIRCGCCLTLRGSRFTQDFGMMKAGSDVHGLWHLLEHGVTCVVLCFSTSIGLISSSRTFHRTMGWVAHINWILPFLKWLPASSKHAVQLSELGQQLVKTRIDTTTQRKDLLYYLVCDVSRFPGTHKLTILRDGRKRTIENG